MTDKGQQKRKMSKSSGGYKALLQSLDEDVSRGLGRSIALKSGSRKGRSCCCRCMRSWIVYACVALILASVLFLAIGTRSFIHSSFNFPFKFCQFLFYFLIHFWFISVNFLFKFLVNFLLFFNSNFVIF